MTAPKGETVWEQVFDKTGALRYLITSKPARDWYTLYEAAPDKLIRRGKARTPPELHDKYITDGDADE